MTSNLKLGTPPGSFVESTRIPPSKILSSFGSLELEQSVTGYKRYRATLSNLPLQVWAHHFSGIDAARIPAIEVRLDRLSKIEINGILRPLFYSSYEGNLVVVTERPDGNRLWSGMGNVDSEEVERWANEIGETLSNLHETGEFHGRLSPHSIFMTAEGPKILGAGLSDLWAPVWTAADIVENTGLRSFISPEVRGNGTQNAGPTADVYSLGAILYSGYTQQLAGEICMMPSTKANVSPSVDRAVLTALNANPSGRQQSIREFMGMFEGLSKEEPVPIKVESVVPAEVRTPPHPDNDLLKDIGIFVKESCLWLAVAVGVVLILALGIKATAGGLDSRQVMEQGETNVFGDGKLRVGSLAQARTTANPTIRPEVEGARIVETGAGRGDEGYEKGRDPGGDGISLEIGGGTHVFFLIICHLLGVELPGEMVEELPSN